MFPKHRLCTSHYHRHWGKRWIQRGPWPHRICTLTRKMNINKTSLYLYVSRLLGLERKLRLSKEIMNEWLACGGIFHRVNMESGIIWDQDQEVTFEEKTKQNEDVTMERSRKTMFLAEETARYRTSGRTGFGLFSDCNNSRLAEGSTGGREWRCNWRGRQGMITYIQAGLAPGWSPSKSAVSLALVKLLLRCWLLSTQTLSRNAETAPLLAQSLPWMSPPPTRLCLVLPAVCLVIAFPYSLIPQADSDQLGRKDALFWEMIIIGAYFLRYFHKHYLPPKSTFPIRTNYPDVLGYLGHFLRGRLGGD